MLSISEHNERYKKPKVYESKSCGCNLSNEGKKQGYHEFFTSFHQQYHNTRAENDEETSKKGSRETSFPEGPCFPKGL